MVKNPYIIVQARMNSERLPGKVLKKIGGKPGIRILFERLEKANIPILLATSTNQENDALVDYVQSLGIKTFRGSEDNVLERYYYAAKSVNADTIIRVTGDNFLMDGSIIKDAYNSYLEQNNRRCFLSIALSKTFPLGISASFFSFDLLVEAFYNAQSLGEIEHVTPYLFNNVPGDIEVKSFAGNVDRYHYRLTVDTPEDFELHKMLIEDFSCEELGIYEIIKLLDQNPRLVEINSGIVQKKWNQ